jgi:hypothetical protein
MTGKSASEMRESTRKIVTVKVQLPLFPGGASEALIYDEQREHTQMRKLDEAEYLLIRKQPKAFCTAWWSDATGWVLLGRTSNKRW